MKLKMILLPGCNRLSMIATGRRPRTDAEALELSIQKWQFIVETIPYTNNHIVHDGGLYSCGLCVRHFNAKNSSQGVCATCPIFLKTGQTHCANTPYSDWVAFRSIENAKKELAFLESLRKPKLQVPGRRRDARGRFIA